MKKILVLILLATLVFVGCSKKEDKSQDAALSVDKLNVTYVTSPLNVPSIVEKHEGIFKKNLGGIDVNYAEITSGADQTTALASGDVDVLYAVGGSSLVAAKAQGQDLKIVSMYSRAPKAFAMFSKDASLNDIKGKKIAGPAGTNLHELLVSYLKKNNMTINDVEFVSMSIPDALAGLESGSIDVALLGGPAAYKAEQAGYHKIADGEGLIEAIIAVATSEKFYNEHKDVIDKIIASQEEIATLMDSKKEDVEKMVTDELKIDSTAYQAMYPQYDFSHQIKDSDIEGLQKTADFMLENQMIKEKLDVKSLFLNK